jgi:hypothetical protein
MSDPTIDRLNNWVTAHKSHSAKIEIDNGYGATCWRVELHVGKHVIHAAEVSFFEDGHYTPENIVYIASDIDEGWPGLAATIKAALDRAEKLFP